MDGDFAHPWLRRQARLRLETTLENAFAALRIAHIRDVCTLQQYALFCARLHRDVRSRLRVLQLEATALAPACVPSAEYPASCWINGCSVFFAVQAQRACQGAQQQDGLDCYVQGVYASTTWGTDAHTAIPLRVKCVTEAPVESPTRALPQAVERDHRRADSRILPRSASQKAFLRHQ